MKNKKIKVANFVKKQVYNNKAIDVSMLPTEDGNYILFGKYAVIKKHNLYEVTSDYDSNIKIFGTLKTAVTWCVFRERKRMSECKHIEHLDAKLASLEIDLIQKAKVLGNIKDDGYRLVYISKIEEDNLKKQIILKQLNRLINTSKEWQTKKFNTSNYTDKR